MAVAGQGQGGRGFWHCRGFLRWGGRESLRQDLEEGNHKRAYYTMVRGARLEQGARPGAVVGRPGRNVPRQRRKSIHAYSDHGRQRQCRDGTPAQVTEGQAGTPGTGWSWWHQPPHAGHVAAALYRRRLARPGRGRRGCGAGLAWALTGADAVVHLAWQVQPNRDLDALHRTNVTGTRACPGSGRAGRRRAHRVRFLG